MREYRLSKVGGVLALAAAALVAADALAQQNPPIMVRITEGVQYTLPGSLPGGAYDPKHAGKQGVLRTLTVMVSNISSRDLDNVEIEFAMYKSLVKGGIGGMELLNYVAPPPSKGKKPSGPLTKAKQALSLKAGETRQFKVEAWMPGELAGGFKTQGLGQAVENIDYNRYYRSTNYNNYQNRNRQTDAPTPVKTASQVNKPTPVESYYGYSVAGFVGGELVVRMDKNPLNLPNFGVVAK